MPVRDTSIHVYLNKVIPNMSRRQAQVYFAFKQSPHETLTDGELQKILGWPINYITGRRGELEKKGVIVDAGRRICTEPPHNVRHCWKLKRQK